MPPRVLIRYDRCELTLKLPIYFAEQDMNKIRKVFKLLADRPYQNETAYETLYQFFPEWEHDLKERLERHGRPDGSGTGRGKQTADRGGYGFRADGTDRTGKARF
jgi:ribosome maturation protein Sdo1